jgi:hypothetical protein
MRSADSMLSREEEGERKASLEEYIVSPRGLCGWGPSAFALD